MENGKLEEATVEEKNPGRKMVVATQKTGWTPSQNAISMLTLITHACARAHTHTHTSHGFQKK